MIQNHPLDFPKTQNYFTRRAASLQSPYALFSPAGFSRS